VAFDPDRGLNHLHGMATHTALIAWNRTSEDFLKGKYSREHTWTFDRGLTVPASPSPAVVPVPYSNPANVDPEEAFVAAIASCHRLTFLFHRQFGQDRDTSGRETLMDPFNS